MFLMLKPLPVALEKNSWRAWFLATRPKTLPLSIPPILLGSALALEPNGVIHLWIAVCALGVSLCIQVGTNLVNDAIDYQKGTDREGRIGPKRMTQEGLLSYRSVLWGGLLSFAFAFVCGIPLMMVGGFPLFLVLLFSVCFGYLYTGGPYPLSYLGISDSFILIFFGWVATGSVYFLQTGHIDSAPFIAGSQIGLLAIVPHAINNIRDRESDALAGKKTLAVRFGSSFVLFEIACCTALPFFFGLYWISQGEFLAAILPFGVLPVMVRNLRGVFKTEVGPEYNIYLAKSALYQFFFSILLALGLVL